MRTILAAGALVILTAGQAAAEPLFLKCEGGTVSVNVYEPDARTGNAWRFYRIDQQQFARFGPSDVSWPANLCTAKGAKCSTTDDLFVMQSRNGETTASIQINRKSGKVVDESKGGGFSSSFIGDCVPSADPAGAGAPNKF